MFLLGKGTDEYVAKEGALKIKEISYIHAEGYSSSSLKHGPFALLDESFPVLLCNMDREHTSKTMNCYEEVKSRNAPIYMISNQNHDIDIENLICVPYNRTYSSLLGLIPIQMFAYYKSVQKGMNPDKPKNLAKVVTVE
jgi:glucosamine--fructose-6-phosphate aminotransferase (isomerizing)